MNKNGDEKDKLIDLRFIDSFKFMSSSLDSLTKTLVRDGKKLFGFEDYSELHTACLPEKEFILMSMLILGIDLTRSNFLQSMHSIAI